MSFGGDGGMMEYAKENMAYRLTMGEDGGVRWRSEGETHIPKEWKMSVSGGEQKMLFRDLFVSLEKKRYKSKFVLHPSHITKSECFIFINFTFSFTADALINEIKVSR